MKKKETMSMHVIIRAIMTAANMTIIMSIMTAANMTIIMSTMTAVNMTITMTIRNSIWKTDFHRFMYICTMLQQ